MAGKLGVLLSYKKSLKSFSFFDSIDSREQKTGGQRESGAAQRQMYLLYATFMLCQQNGKSRKIYSTSSVWCSECACCVLK